MSSRTFGAYGGRYVPETLIPALDELDRGLGVRARRRRVPRRARPPRPDVRRPSDAAHAAERFAPEKRLYLKREDLLHTGAHKLNNALGQAVLARRLGKRRIVAETGAGQHGVATATVCARFGLECVVYMGSEDMRRQTPNVERMGLLGAEVRPGRVRHADAEGGDERGDPRLDHERRDDALPDRLVRRAAAVPGDRPRAAGGDRARGARAVLEAEGRLPDAVVACVGGGSNAIGMFAGFVDDADVELVGVEAAGAASLGTGRTGVLHGARSSVLADEDGQIADAHSISAGLDYPGVGPEHAFLRDSGRARYVAPPTRKRSPPSAA